MTVQHTADIKDQLRLLMAEQTRLLDLLIHELAQKNFDDAEIDEIANTVLLMLQSMGVSVHSILRLTDTVDMAIKDCFGIARTVSEMSINVAYIVSSDVEVARRAKLHALQKQFRDLKRSGAIDGMEIQIRRSVIPKTSDVPDLEKALTTFTNKKGQEIRDWTPLSLDQRITKVGSLNKRAVTSLFGSKFAIYRHSSELLHGTYFGVLYFWTSPSGERLNREGFEETWIQIHLVTLFTAVFFGIIGAIESCASRFELTQFSDPIRDLTSRALKIVDASEN